MLVALHTPWPCSLVLGLDYIMSNNTGAIPRFFPFAVNSTNKSFTTKKQEHDHNEKNARPESV